MVETYPDRTNLAAAETESVEKATGAENEPVEAETDPVYTKGNTEAPVEEIEKQQSYSNFKLSDPISIDGSDFDVDPAPTQFMLNNGLPYLDHDYDVFDPNKRYKKKSEDDQKFPKLLGLSDSPEPTEGGTSAPNRSATAPRFESVGPLQPLGRQSDEGIVQQHQQAAQGARSGISFQPKRADMIYVYDPVYGQFRTAPPQPSASMAPNGRSLFSARIPPPQSTYNPPPKPTSQLFTTAFLSEQQAATVQQHDYLEEDTGTPPTLKPAAPRIGQSPHRMPEAPSGNQLDDAPHRMAQRGAQFNAADPSKAAYAHAPAPMLVPGRGSKPVMRGRTGSRPSRSGKEDHPETAVNQEGVSAPFPNRAGATPGKKEGRQKAIAGSRRAFGNEVAGGRGRGRPKNSTSSRVRSSLSGSSDVGDVNNGEMGSPGGGLTTNRMPPSPAGSSPVKTNIDSASMPLPSGRNDPRRAVYPIPQPARNGSPPTAPARGHAREEPQPAKGCRGRKPKAAPAPKVMEPANELGHEEEEQDWVTRCICGMTHSDDFMVACDRCDVWQHGKCFGLNQKDVGDNDEYVCEVCDPGRKLKYTKDQARDIQRRQLEKMKRASAGRGRKGKKQQVVTTATTTTKKAAGRPARSLSTVSSKKLEQISCNVYSDKAKRLIDVSPPSHHSQFALPVHPQVTALFVASGIQGLVTTAPVAEGTVLMELVGRVCLPDECLPATHLSSHPYQAFCVLYDGFADPKATPTVQQESYLCIDSRKHGNDSRMVRRCCRPNCVIRHMVENGEVHFLIVAKENLPQTTEILIPFDLDQAVTRDNCACYVTTDASDCLIYLNAPFEKGHGAEPEELDETADASPISRKVVPEKGEQKGRPEKDVVISAIPTANGYVLKPPSVPSRVLKEEKSEEEMVAQKEEPSPEVVLPKKNHESDVAATLSGRRGRRSSPMVRPASPAKKLEASLPFKKRRDMREAGQISSGEQKRAEAANVLAGMGTARERTESPELLQELNTAVDSEPKVNVHKEADFVLPTLSPTGGYDPHLLLN